MTQRGSADPWHTGSRPDPAMGLLIHDGSLVDTQRTGHKAREFLFFIFLRVITFCLYEQPTMTPDPIKLPSYDT